MWVSSCRSSNITRRSLEDEEEREFIVLLDLLKIKELEEEEHKELRLLGSSL